MKRLVLGLGLFLALSLALVACGGGQRTATLDVQMTDEFRFIPDRFEVPADAEVTLNLTNVGALEHDFVLLEQGTEVTTPVDESEIEDDALFDQDIEPGDTGTFTFQAPAEPGEYRVICAIPGHLEQGMEATLVVTE